MIDNPYWFLAFPGILALVVIRVAIWVEGWK